MKDNEEPAAERIKSSEDFILLHRRKDNDAYSITGIF